MTKLRVLVVGQTPPPFGGQAMAIETLLRGDYEAVEFSHVRMAFSKEIADIGRLRVGKVLQLPWLVLRIWWARLRTGARVLYYPPTGAERVPFYRDVFVLGCSRWAFRWTAFHFEAGGLASAHETFGTLKRWLFRLAYGRPDMAVELYDAEPSNAAVVRARRTAVVPNGVADEAVDRLPRRADRGAEPLVLYVGVLRESKGALVLLRACAALARRGTPFRLRLVGEFQPASFEVEFRAQVAALGLDGLVDTPGRRVGDDKWSEYLAADVFCFPSFFEHENFPLVVLEAMQFELPVVATRWRGIGAMVADGETGWLVEPGDAEALAERLDSVLARTDRGRDMGRAGRSRYLSQFTVEHYRRGMEAALAAVAEQART